MKIIEKFIKDKLSSEVQEDIVVALILLKYLGNVCIDLIPDVLAVYDKIDKENMNLWCVALTALIKKSYDEDRNKLLLDIKTGIDTLVSIMLVQTQGITIEESDLKVDSGGFVSKMFRKD